MKSIKTNAAQIAALRRALRDKTTVVHCDRCTGKALAARGFAIEREFQGQPGRFWEITAAGRERAAKAADVFGPCTSPEANPDMQDAMRDLA